MSASFLLTGCIYRIGIAIGPQTWFGDYFGGNVSSSGTVLNNRITGALGYGIAVTSASNFAVQGNTLFGNTAFISSRGPNCSVPDPTPASAAFIVQLANVTSSSLQSDFQQVQDAKVLPCVVPPDGGDLWPYGGLPQSSSSSSSLSSNSSHGSMLPSPSASSSAKSSAVKSKSAVCPRRAWRRDT